MRYAHSCLRSTDCLKTGIGTKRHSQQVSSGLAILVETLQFSHGQAVYSRVGVNGVEPATQVGARWMLQRREGSEKCLKTSGNAMSVVVKTRHRAGETLDLERNSARKGRTRGPGGRASGSMVILR